MIDYEGIAMSRFLAKNTRDARTAVLARDRMINGYERQIVELQAALRAERRKTADLLEQIAASAE